MRFTKYTDRMHILAKGFIEAVVCSGKTNQQHQQKQIYTPTALSLLVSRYQCQQEFVKCQLLAGFSPASLGNFANPLLVHWHQDIADQQNRGSDKRLRRQRHRGVKVTHSIIYLCFHVVLFWLSACACARLYSFCVCLCLRE